MSDEVHTKDVPYIVHEMAMARMERQIKRMFVITLVLIAVLLGTNGAWLYHESQYVDEVTETYMAETDGGGTAIATRESEVSVNGKSELH